MSDRVTELHSIMPIANIQSVLEYGIVSHEESAKFPHRDVSMQEIQDRRSQVRVPQGLRLHQYANLYFHARNPMLYKQQGEVENLCILRVSTDVFQIENAVITDQNASSQYAKFLHPEALNELELEQIYARNWNHDDPIAYWRHKSQKCAEVLIPHSIPPKYIIGAYVVSETVKQKLTATGFSHNIKINSDIFFR
jgi:hypothetical protein